MSVTVEPTRQVPISALSVSNHVFSRGSTKTCVNQCRQTDTLQRARPKTCLWKACCYDEWLKYLDLKLLKVITRDDRFDNI